MGQVTLQHRASMSRRFVLSCVPPGSAMLVQRLGLAEAPESRPSVLLVERLGLAEAPESRRSVLSCRTIRGGGRVETPLSDSEGNLGISELPSGNSPRPLGC